MRHNAGMHNVLIFTFALRRNNRFACIRKLRKLENGTLMIERLVILYGALWLEERTVQLCI